MSLGWPIEDGGVDSCQWRSALMLGFETLNQRVKGCSPAGCHEMCLRLAKDLVLRGWRGRYM